MWTTVVTNVQYCKGEMPNVHFSCLDVSSWISHSSVSFWTLVMPGNRVTSLSNVQSPCLCLTQMSVYCPACVSFYASKPVTILGGDVKCPVSMLCAKYWNRNHLQQWKGNICKMCSYTWLGGKYLGCQICRFRVRIQAENKFFKQLTLVKLYANYM